jgi:hypothetical protein
MTVDHDSKLLGTISGRATVFLLPNKFYKKILGLIFSILSLWVSKKIKKIEK